MLLWALVMYVSEQINSYGRSGHEIQNTTTKGNPQHLENATKTTIQRKTKTNAEHFRTCIKNVQQANTLLRNKKASKPKRKCCYRFPRHQNSLLLPAWFFLLSHSRQAVFAQRGLPDHCVVLSNVVGLLSYNIKYTEIAIFVKYAI